MEYDYFMLGHEHNPSDRDEVSSEPLGPCSLGVLAWINTDTRQKFIFVYDNASEHLLEPTFRRIADNPELQFNRVDAAILMNNLRKQQEDEEIISGEGVDPSRLFDDLQPLTPKELEWKF